MPGGSPITVRLQDLTVDVSISGHVQGDILYRGSAKWQNLAAGTAGNLLATGGAGANPSWTTNLTYSGANSGTGLTVQAPASGKGLAVKATATSPGNIIEVQNSSGTALAYMDSGGSLHLTGSNKKFISEDSAGSSNFVGVFAGTSLALFQYPQATKFGIQASSGQSDGGSNQYSCMSFGPSRNTMFGDMVFSQSDPGYQLTVQTSSSSKQAFVVKGAASQSANLQEWQNSSGAIQLAISPSGVIDRPEPTATTGASQAGLAISLTASDAVASTDTAGAAAGGNVTIGTGAGARLTSGNAQGGDLLVTFGAGIGTGRQGALVFSNSKAWIGANGGTQGGIGLNNPFNGDVSFGTGSGAFTNPKVIIDNNGGAISMCSGHYLAWSSSATDAGSSADTGLKRSSAGVVTVTGGLSGNGSLLLTAASSSTIPCTIKGAASQSANLQEWSSSALAVYGTVSENGYFTTRKNSAPADAELATSELAFWFDDTDGAAKLKIKAKNSAGTVVTGEVALA